MSHPNFAQLCPPEDDDDYHDSNEAKTEVILEELKRYRKFKYLCSDQSDPLKFYKNNKVLMPYLCRIAKLVFSTTASSVPSECVFSTAGELINAKRTRLDPLLTEDLLFLNKNDFE